MSKKPIRARVHQNTPSGLYWGQIYNEKKKKWEDVTLSCFTKSGAKRALKRWKKQHNIEDEFLL